MVKITKSQAQKRLQEAIKKVQTVYMADNVTGMRSATIVTTSDMAGIEKIIYKCMNRLK